MWSHWSSRAFQLDLRHVAYRGTSAALPDLFAARIPAHFAASAELIEHHAGGKLRILATGGAQRSPALRDVPTFQESGADIQATGWYAFYAPARTAADAVKSLEKQIMTLAHDAELRARILAIGFQPTGTTGDQLRQIQRSEFDHWKRVVAATGLKGEP
jgi:tripartite-type tricarboxylate transporter receptor subunit TctC